MIGVYLVDDHALIREGCRQILESENDIEVVGESGSGKGLLDAMNKVSFDVLLLDLTLPDVSGIELLRQIDGNKLKVVALTMHAEVQFVRRVFELGGCGYLTKDAVVEELPKAIRTVMRKEQYLAPGLAERCLDFLSESTNLPHEKLSQREFQVLHSLANGKTIKQISIDLGLSVKTISTYRTRLLKKLNLKTNLELLKYAVVQGIAK